VPSRSLNFRPRFTLMLLYLAGFYVFYALLLALPDLLAGFRELGPGPEQLTPEELARAKGIAQQAIGGKTVFALLAALATVGLGTWRRLLPGMR
jgi:hypothetical protein